ncbi:MAG: hypothetical protein OXI66_17865 [Boseongicola sp.]|nr:hypothetical protein [Boseongicola sp.]MDE0347624.1 hypothetical protein [Boseongicola sp.]
MEFTCERAQVATHDWREVLLVAFELGLSSPLSFECLIDRAERREWGGPWL